MSIRKISATVVAVPSDLHSGEAHVPPSERKKNKKKNLKLIPAPLPEEEPLPEATPQNQSPEPEAFASTSGGIEDQDELLNLRGLLSEKTGNLKKSRGNQTYLSSKTEGKKSSRVKKGCMVDTKIN